MIIVFFFPRKIRLFLVELTADGEVYCLKLNLSTPSNAHYERVQERVLTGGNASKNRVPSCAGSASGPDQKRVNPDYSTGCWSM